MCPGNITGLRQEKRECVLNQIISGVLFQLLYCPPECCKFALFGSARTNQTKGQDVWTLTGPNKADLKNRMKSKAQAAAVYTRLHFKYSRVRISGTSVTTCEVHGEEKMSGQNLQQHLYDNSICNTCCKSFEPTLT